MSPAEFLLMMLLLVCVCVCVKGVKCSGAVKIKEDKGEPLNELIMMLSLKAV